MAYPQAAILILLISSQLSTSKPFPKQRDPQTRSRDEGKVDREESI